LQDIPYTRKHIIKAKTCKSQTSILCKNMN